MQFALDLLRNDDRNTPKTFPLRISKKRFREPNEYHTNLASKCYISALRSKRDFHEIVTKKITYFERGYAEFSLMTT